DLQNERRQQMRTKALRLLKERVTQARTNPALFADIAHGLKLLEGDPMIAEGRIETLHDLQRRALAAESTHDPKVLQDLVAALRAFLTEELDEATRIRAKAQAQRTDESEGGACEACGHSLQGTKPEVGGAVTCPSCGHQSPATASESDDDEFVQ